MLTSEIKHTENYTDTIKIDGVTAVILSGNFTTAQTTPCVISQAVSNPELYRTNRDAIDAERKTFEDLVWAAQDEMDADIPAED